VQQLYKVKADTKKPSRRAKPLEGAWILVPENGIELVRPLLTKRRILRALFHLQASTLLVV
jgi:hypothetical protein